MILVKVLPYFSCLLLHLFESLKALLGGSGVNGLKQEVCRVELNCHDQWQFTCSSPSKEKMGF